MNTTFDETYKSLYNRYQAALNVGEDELAQLYKLEACAYLDALEAQEEADNSQLTFEWAAGFTLVLLVLMFLLMIVA